MLILSSGEANRSFVFDFVRTTTRVWHLILASIRKIVLGHRCSALDRGFIAAATAAATASETSIKSGITSKQTTLADRTERALILS